MDIKFEGLKCFHCNSKNLGSTLWYPEITSEELENYMLTDGVSYTGSDFSVGDEFNFLVKCRDCSRWVQIDVSQTEINKRCSVSPDLECSINPILEFDPITGIPQKIYIGLFSFEVESSIYQSSEFNFPQNAGPFYPYPIGIYSLLCKSVETEKYPGIFKCKVAKFDVSGSILSENEDVDFYTFHFQWIDSKSLRFLEDIIKLSENLQTNTIDKSIDLFFTKSDFDIEQLKKSLNTSQLPQSVNEKITKIAGQARNRQAYSFLNWLENETRRYVWKIYVEKYTPDKEYSKWWKSCFPESVRWFNFSRGKTLGKMRG